MLTNYKVDQLASWPEEALINLKRKPDDWLGCLEVGRALRARRADGSESRPYQTQLCRDAVPTLPVAPRSARSADPTSRQALPRYSILHTLYSHSTSGQPIN